MKNLPLKNVIVLGGEGDTCENALALGKAIAANNYYNKYKLVWLCDHPDKFESSINELFLDRNTLKERNSILVRLKYYYWMCTAKYIIFENKRIKKFREDQMSVYLTHGAIDLKNIKTVVTLPEDLNYVVYPSDYIASRWAKEFSISMDRVILCGSPRTDILFQQCDNNDIIKFLKVDQFNKTIIWTPTFRKHVNGHRNDSKVDLPYGVPIIKGEQEWEILNEFLVKNNIQIILKPHRYQDMTCIKAMDSLNFRVISQQELDEKGLNVYDIMPYMDAMVSDYSSITFDFMLLDRPIGYTIDDMEDYKLGFAVDNIFDFMPGHKFKTIDEFIAFLIDVCEGADVYFNQRKKVLHGLNEFADGENANRLCEKLKLSK